MDKRGFTLIELLAVIVVLGLVLTITVPTVITAIEGIRKESFADAAKMMIASTRTVISEEKTIRLPPNNFDATIVKLSYLKLDSMEKDVDGGYYSENNSYVLIVKLNDEIVYYVTTQGSKRSINLAKEENINGDLVRSNINTTIPKAVGNTYSSSELGETGPFTVTVRYSY